MRNAVAKVESRGEMMKCLSWDDRTMLHIQLRGLQGHVLLSLDS